MNVEIVPLNQTFDLIFGEDPSTGSSWQIEFPSSFRKVNEVFRLNQPVMPSSGGYTTYTLLPMARGQYTVYASYYQPGMGDGMDYEITVNVV